MLTRKDFIELAEMCSKIQNEADRCFLIRNITHFCAKNNPRFDNRRFEEWVAKEVAEE